MESVAENFEKQHSIDVKNRLKARLSLLEGVEKMRKALSADNEAKLEIDSLVDEIEVDEDMTLEVFNEMIEPYTQRLRDLFASLVQELDDRFGITNEDITKVELLGDVSRTTIFQDVIKEAFEIDSLNRTMHSQNTIAKGASVLSSIRNRKIQYNKLPFVLADQQSQ